MPTTTATNFLAMTSAFITHIIAWIGQGPIADRTKENIGASDMGRMPRFATATELPPPTIERFVACERIGRSLALDRYYMA